MLQMKESEYLAVHIGQHQREVIWSIEKYSSWPLCGDKEAKHGSYRNRCEYMDG